MFAGYRKNPSIYRCALCKKWKQNKFGFYVLFDWIFIVQFSPLFMSHNKKMLVFSDTTLVNKNITLFCTHDNFVTSQNNNRQQQHCSKYQEKMFYKIWRKVAKLFFEEADNSRRVDIISPRRQNHFLLKGWTLVIRPRLNQQLELAAQKPLQFFAKQKQYICHTTYVI